MYLSTLFTVVAVEPGLVICIYVLIGIYLYSYCLINIC